MSMLKSIKSSRTGHATDEDRKLVTIDIKGGARTFELQNIAIASISPDINQPRRTFTAAALNELADDLKSRGLLQPIGLRPDGNGGYIIVFGERRFRAASLLEWQTIPAIVLDLTDAALILEAQIVENTQRENFELLEIAAAFAKLVDMVGSAAEAARRISISPSLGSQYMAIATTESLDIVELVRDGYTSDARTVYELTKIAKEAPSTAHQIIQSIRDGKSSDVRSMVSSAARAVTPATAARGRAVTKKPGRPRQEQVQVRPEKIAFEAHPNQDLVYLLTVDDSTPLILDYNVAKDLFQQMTKHF